MTQHLTADLIAEALAEYEEIWVGYHDLLRIVFDKPPEGGVVRAALWEYDTETDREAQVEARTFRIVEVES